MFHVLPDVGPVYSVSIIPTGSAGGYTMPLPEQDEMFNTKGKMLQDITVALGGRVAEEIIFDDIDLSECKVIEARVNTGKHQTHYEYVLRKTDAIFLPAKI